jgi:hypothetical protein
VLLQSFLALVHDWCFPENTVNANKVSRPYNKKSSLLSISYSLFVF